MRRHVVISGTGRAGTSFLVKLLTQLGMDTGFTPETLEKDFDAETRAGLEHNVRDPEAPYVVKSPLFCNQAQEVLQRHDILIEHVFIPIRDLYGAAESRRFVLDTARAKMGLWARLWSWVRTPELPGGLWNTRFRARQERVLMEAIYRLTLALADSNTPVTFLRYPRLVQDSAYLFEKLRPILSNVSHAHFDAVFARLIRPEWVHSFGDGDR